MDNYLWLKLFLIEYKEILFLFKILTASALSTENLALFPSLKLLKPLSINTLIFNQQVLIIR